MHHLVWDVNPVIFKWHFLQLRWYGLFFIASFFLGFLIIKKIFQEEKVDTSNLDDWLLYTLIGAIIGARLIHCLFYEPHYYLKHPLEIFFVWKGGLASHGGMLGAMVVFYLYAKKQKKSYMWVLSRVAIIGPLVGVGIRIGNFFNSEILGKTTSMPWGVIFARVDSNPRHPVQLYEALGYFIIFLFLWFVYKKATYQFANKILPALFAILLFGTRFLLEFFKTKQADFSLSIPLTMGQVLSIPLIILGVVWSSWAFYTTPKNKRWKKPL